MKLKLVMVGKNNAKWIESCIVDYAKRINAFIIFELKYVKEAKNTDNPSLQVKIESASILKEIAKEDFVVLLDEHGHQFTSKKFALEVEAWRNASKKCVVFVIGGAYGFDEAIFQRANMKMAISSMTLTHQMVRVFFAEQLYRAFTIIKKLPYHH